MPTLASIQIGQPQRFEPVAGEVSNKSWTTAFYKTPVEGPISATAGGLAGDQVAETRVHGGPDKAICVYSADHLAYWREELQRGEEFAAAAFGENFTIEGLTEADVCLGDVWQIGTAEFEISQPRQPCWKLARRWKTKDLTARVQRTGYTGWYLRVTTEGTVTAGDPIRLKASPLAEWTIERANRVMYELKDDREATAALAAVEPLAASWKRQLLKRL